MDDRDAVARDMERIFGPAEGPRTTGAGVLASRRGHAAAWLAVALAAVGVAVVGTDRSQTPVPTPLAPPPVVRPAPAPIPGPSAAAIRTEPLVPARRSRSTRVRRPVPMPTIRIARPLPSPSSARPEAPRLTGEALRRALAEDVVITRRLNQQALARATAPAD